MSDITIQPGNYKIRNGRLSLVRDVEDKTGDPVWSTTPESPNPPTQTFVFNLERSDGSEPSSNIFTIKAVFTDSSLWVGTSGTLGDNYLQWAEESIKFQFERDKKLVGGIAWKIRVLDQGLYWITEKEDGSIPRPHKVLLEPLQSSSIAFSWLLEKV